MAQTTPDPRQKKGLHWVGNSREDLLEFPEEVRKDIGYALGAAQFGEKAEGVKAWKGCGSGVLEIVQPFDGNAYRTVYAAFFLEAVYVLHAFQKKSPDGGSKTDKRDVEAIEQALRGAKEHHAEVYGRKDKRNG